MKPKVYGNPIKCIDPFHLIKTTLLLTFNCFADLKTENYIIYNTNNIAEISRNCMFGHCKVEIKEQEEPSEFHAIVIPECNEGKSKIEILIP